MKLLTLNVLMAVAAIGFGAISVTAKERPNLGPHLFCTLEGRPAYSGDFSECHAPRTLAQVMLHGW